MVLIYTCSKLRTGNGVVSSSEASPTFGHANGNFSEFLTVYIRNEFSKEMHNDNDLNLHSMTKLSGCLRYWL